MLARGGVGTEGFTKRTGRWLNVIGWAGAYQDPEALRSRKVTGSLTDTTVRSLTLMGPAAGGRFRAADKLLEAPLCATVPGYLPLLS
jgi:hypothetical protein